MFPRFLKNSITQIASLFPVTYLAGPRQAGKSTLVKNLDHPRRNYFTMDSLQTLNAAKQNPQEFIRLCKNPCTIDEIQRCFELLLPIKDFVDSTGQKGHFLLTGSSNILSMPKVSDSLAGRMAIFELLPLSVQEILGFQKNWILELFANPSPEVLPSKSNINYEDICEFVIYGGYPDVYKSDSKKYKNIWFESYIKSMIERDLREINDYKSVIRIHRLFQLLSLRSATTVNIMDFARITDIPASSLTIYLDALESLFLIKRIPAYYSNLNNRLTKACKVYLVDSGLMCHKVDITFSKTPWEHREWGQVFETFVVNEIRKQLPWLDSAISLYHYRTHQGKEIDLVLENKQQEIIAVEIKASRTLTTTSAKNFAQIKADTGDKFKIGIVIYAGNSIEVLGDKVYAIPLSCII
jgi:predicted AAA+ superfamily ATPase